VNKLTVLDTPKARRLSTDAGPTFSISVCVSPFLSCLSFQFSEHFGDVTTHRKSKNKDTRPCDTETPSSLPRDCIPLELLRHFLEMFCRGGHVPFRFLGGGLSFVASHFIPQTD
jgi:hypothetical protein